MSKKTKNIISVIIIIIGFSVFGVSIYGIVSNKMKQKEESEKLEVLVEDSSIDEYTTESLPDYIDMDNLYIATPIEENGEKLDVGLDSLSEKKETTEAVVEDSGNELKLDATMTDAGLFEISDIIIEDKLGQIPLDMTEELVTLGKTEAEEYSAVIFSFNESNEEEWLNQVKAKVNEKYSGEKGVYPERIRNCFEDHKVNAKYKELRINKIELLEYVPEETLASVKVYGYVKVDMEKDGESSAEKYILIDTIIIINYETKQATHVYYYFAPIFNKIKKVRLTNDGQNTLNYSGDKDDIWYLDEYDPAVYHRDEH